MVLFLKFSILIIIVPKEKIINYIIINETELQAIISNLVPSTYFFLSTCIYVNNFSILPYHSFDVFIIKIFPLKFSI